MKAVIFDIDNTLIDFTERKRVSIKESVKAMIDAGLDEDFYKLHEDFSKFYWEVGIEDQKIFQKYLMSRYGKIDYRVLAYAIIAYRKASNGLLHSYPGAKSLLIYLKEKGYKLAILSDAPKLEAYIRLCSVGLDDFFDLILTKDDVKVTKPHSKGFVTIAKRFGIQTEDCIMIGDNVSRDVGGAKKLGMITIHAKYGLVKTNKENNKKIKADYTANTVREIIEIIDKLK